MIVTGGSKQDGFHANAVVHVGTHGTQEWLTGKEAGLSASDPTEALIGDLKVILGARAVSA